MYIDLKQYREKKKKVKTDKQSQECLNVSSYRDAF